jgi:hypothetical protein
MTYLTLAATAAGLTAITAAARHLRHVGGITNREIATLAVGALIYATGLAANIIPLIGIGLVTLIAGCASAATPPRGDQLDPVDAILATAPGATFPAGYENATTLAELAGLPADYGAGGVTKWVVDYPAGDDRVAQLQHTVELLSDRLVALGEVVDGTTRLTAQGFTEFRTRLDAITGGTP